LINYKVIPAAIPLSATQEQRRITLSSRCEQQSLGFVQSHNRTGYPALAAQMLYTKPNTPK